MLKQGCLLLLELLNDCKLLEELPRPVVEPGEMIGPDHSSCSGRGWSLHSDRELSTCRAFVQGGLDEDASGT